MRFHVLATGLVGLLCFPITVTAQQPQQVDDLADKLMPKIEASAPAERVRSMRQQGDLSRGISTIAPSAAAPSQLVSLTVEFDTGSSTLRPEGKAVLDRLAQSMNKVKQRTRSMTSQTLVLNMMGHTDHRGSEEFNDRLSEQRAAAAKAYLKELWGFKDEEIVAAGKGKTSPINRNTPCDEACMQVNRRVDVQTSLR